MAGWWNGSRRPVLAVAVAVATAVAVVACGSSGGGSSAGASSSGGVSGPIAVGAVGSYSGAQAASQAGGEQVINAWAQWVNAHGGINGRQVKLYVADDQDSASVALTAVQTLVAQDHVTAIIDGSNFDSSFAAYAQQQGVPVLGGDSYDPIFLTNPDFFPAGANTVAINYGLMANAKSLGSKFAYLYCAASPICAQNAPIFQKIGASIGVSLPLVQSVPESVADYTPQCTALKSAGVKSFSYIDASGNVLKLLAACSAQGVTAPLVTLGGTITPNWASQPGTNGVISAEGNFPFVDDSVPATQEFHAALKQYAPGIGNLLGSTAADQWVGGALFEAAVKAAPAGAVTAATVKEGLYSFKGETLGGLAPPLTYTRGKVTLVNCYYTMAIQNKTIVAPDGLKVSCAPDALISSIIQSLHLT